MKRALKYNSLLKIFNNYLYDSLLPININYMYNFGSLLGFFLIIQIISGIFLAFYYIAHIDIAFDSIEYIMREVPYGYLVRYIHANGAALFFVMVYIHIARGLMYGSYKIYTGRTYAWNIGVIIFLLMIITAFIGYSLVYGQLSMWAIVVITNLITVIPYYGHDILEYIYGGFNVGGPTLTRFYSLHYILPIIISALSMAHLITLHSVGGSNPLGIINIKSMNYINFHPYYSLKDLLGIFIVLIFYIFFVFFAPNYLGHPDNYIPANSLVTPSHIVPEFYLLPFYAILRSIPNKAIGVLALLGAIIILVILPYIEVSIINTMKFKPISKIFLFIFFINFLLLVFIGQAVAADPYILLGQIFTLYYFGYFIIIVPVVSFIETLLFMLLQKSK